MKGPWGPGAKRGKKNQSQKRDRRQRLGMWAFTYTPGHIQLDHRWAFFVLSGSADLQSILETYGFVPARCRPGSISAQGVVARMGAWTGIWERGRQRETAVLAGFLAPSGLPFSFVFFRLLSSSSLLLFLHTSTSHTFPLETLHCTTFHTVVRGGSAVVRLGGETRAGLGRARCPPSNTTNDAAIGQKRNIPTLLRRWLCPRHTVGTCGLGSLHVEHGGGARCLEKARPFSAYSGITSLATNPHQPVSSIM